MLLAEYLTNPRAAWHVVPEWRSNANDHFQRPEDTARIKELSGFTPQVAMSLLGAAQLDVQADPGASLTTPQQVRSSSSRPKAPEAKPTPTPSEEPTSSTPWSIIVVLIVAATGLLWLLVKKMK